MFEDELQIPELAGVPEVLGTLPPGDGIDVSATPALDELAGRSVRLVPSLDQIPGDPGAAPLVFLPKLTPSAGPDQRDPFVQTSHVLGLRSPVAKARRVSGLAARGLVDQTSAGARGEDHRAIHVIPE